MERRITPVEYAKGYLRVSNSELPALMHLIKNIPRFRRMQRKEGIVPEVSSYAFSFRENVSKTFGYLQNLINLVGSKHMGQPGIRLPKKLEDEVLGSAKILHAAKGFEGESPTDLSGYNVLPLYSLLTIGLGRVLSQKNVLNGEDLPNDLIWGNMIHQDAHDGPNGKGTYSDFANRLGENIGDRFSIFQQDWSILRNKISGVLLGMGYKPDRIRELSKRAYRQVMAAKLYDFYTNLPDEKLSEEFQRDRIAQRVVDAFHDSGIQHTEEEIKGFLGVVADAIGERRLEGISLDVDLGKLLKVPMMTVEDIRNFRMPPHEFRDSVMHVLKNKVRKLAGPLPSEVKTPAIKLDDEFRELFEKNQNLIKKTRKMLEPEEQGYHV